MFFSKNLLSWKTVFYSSIAVILFLDVLSFYGLYTHKFYFFKIDNYFFPLLSLVHIAYIYAIWFKVKEDEPADMQMRNIEYFLYLVLLVYAYELIETCLTLYSYGEFAPGLLPNTFIPLGFFTLLLQLALITLTFMALSHRKRHIGSYNPEEINAKNIDSWQ